ncbi:MAG TPA: DUF4145 domain-containing protein [Cyclobacteriaceae bacterium]
MNEFDDQSDSMPTHWRCPTCTIGILTLIKKKFHLEETTKSIKTKHRETPSYADYIFTGILKCNNSTCQDKVSFSGKAYQSDYERQTGEHLSETIEIVRFEPLYFFPTLHLFEIQRECPLNIKNEIIKAFGHFFNDLSACANKIRIAVELILTEQGVQQTIINTKKKRERLSLHSRIMKFKKDNPKFDNSRNRLLAIKWIGNDGSHTNGRLRPLDLLSAFELLEDILEKLYDEKERRLTWIASDVNKRKGITPKRKTIPKWLKGN